MNNILTPGLDTPSPAAEVARLTWPDRVARVEYLMNQADEILAEALEVHAQKHRVVGTCVLFSGGNDSTVLAHLMKKHATHAVHCNTTIGIEETRQFVRDTCQLWGLPLIEEVPPADYRELVLDQGFPGPGHHFKMFQRLKERGLRQARRKLVVNPRQERVVFLAGRRRQESARRANIPLFEREGSIVWVSPIAMWTKPDMIAYRLMNAQAGDQIPNNTVSDMLHMSGECLCGSFAKAGELDQIAMFYPEVAEYIRGLEAEIADREDIPDRRKRWGWGAYADVKPSKATGALCTSCTSPSEVVEPLAVMNNPIREGAA